MPDALIAADPSGRAGLNRASDHLGGSGELPGMATTTILRMITRKRLLRDNCGTQCVVVTVAVTHVSPTSSVARGGCAGSLVFATVRVGWQIANRLSLWVVGSAARRWRPPGPRGGFRPGYLPPSRSTSDRRTRGAEPVLVHPDRVRQWCGSQGKLKSVRPDKVFTGLQVAVGITAPCRLHESSEPASDLGRRIESEASHWEGSHGPNA
jgi:hypothetical protein